MQFYLKKILLDSQRIYDMKHAYQRFFLYFVGKKTLKNNIMFKRKSN
jgi:hypothetical protein